MESFIICEGMVPRWNDQKCCTFRIEFFAKSSGLGWVGAQPRGLARFLMEIK